MRDRLKGKEKPKQNKTPLTQAPILLSPHRSHQNQYEIQPSAVSTCSLLNNLPIPWNKMWAFHRERFWRHTNRTRNFSYLRKTPGPDRMAHSEPINQPTNQPTNEQEHHQCISVQGCCINKHALYPEELGIITTLQTIKNPHIVLFGLWELLEKLIINLTDKQTSDRCYMFNVLIR